MQPWWPNKVQAHRAREANVSKLLNRADQLEHGAIEADASQDHETSRRLQTEANRLRSLADQAQTR